MYESLQNDITAESRFRERGNSKIRKNEDESLFFAGSCCQSTFLILSERLSDLVKVPFWPCHLTEMVASERLSDRQYRRNFIVKLLFSWRKKRHTSVSHCIPTVYKTTLKNRKIESNIVVGSENRKEKGGKMSVYSTKKMEDDTLQEIVLIAHATVAV